MTYKQIDLGALSVNRANDRHGELENETYAIAWLFANREAHMKKLAKDIVDQNGILEPPLVMPEGGSYIVYDGNRRVTCLKLIHNPASAPNVDLQEYFQSLNDRKKPDFPISFLCQIETDGDLVDEILLRRHTGVQGGIGQSTWDDRMKENFIIRTGKSTGPSVADEVERHLSARKLIANTIKIPRSTLNRLLSSEYLRKKVGFSFKGNKIIFTHDEQIVMNALAKIANDLASKKVVLGHLWDNDSKLAYLEKLNVSGFLPTAKDIIPPSKGTVTPSAPTLPASLPLPPVVPPLKRQNLIAQTDYGVNWNGKIQRHRNIWEELQHRLNFSSHMNAISVLFRVLLEISVDNYIDRCGLSAVFPTDKLSLKIQKVASDLRSKGKIDSKYENTLKKLQQHEKIISIDTLNKYVHSPTFSPSPDHLRAIWDSLSHFIVQCLNA